MSLGVSGQPDWPPAHQQTQLPRPQSHRKPTHTNVPNPFWNAGALIREFWAHPYMPRSKVAQREVELAGDSGPLCWVSGQAGSPPMAGASCAPQWPGGRECSMSRRPGSCSRQAHKSTDLQVLGLCMPTCLVTNIPVPKRDRKNRFQGL